ncbi:ParB N-terminal domain-containing protein [Tropicimonas sp. S265A]|uniref:ParB N-terminal domain-containing protein n=1 Tax=Tropicimonas sp. S265A TaxID=3415134 RepID=UPI003C7A8801
MRKAKLIESISEVPVAEILAEDRLRPVVETGVQSLIESIEKLGVLKDPIHVRKVKHKKGQLVLIAGAHRLAAAKALGWKVIPAKVWDCTDDWASLMEIDDNLSGADLDTIDLCVFLAERKRVYERLHPETKKGGVRGNQHTGGRQTDTMSFCQNVAQQRDLTDRQIRRLVAAGTALGRDEVSRLRNAPSKVTLADLQEIAKAGPVERYDIVAALSVGKAKTAKEALSQAKGEVEKPSRTDAAFLKLQDAWARAPKEAQRSFVSENRSLLVELLSAEGESS